MVGAWFGTIKVAIKVAEKIEMLDEDSLMYPLYLVQSSAGYTQRYL